MKTANKNIVIFDFDDTWTTNRSAFRAMRSMLVAFGYEAFLVTARDMNDPTNDQIFIDWSPEMVIFTEGEQKISKLRDANFPIERIAFFIDDSPESIPDLEWTERNLC
ncbi:hypothetical protein VCHA53O466_50443 [Vibrio chagasii]|nr:hypothetical protein VCHA53O466_50443 [Vibrio chagasii]